MSYDWDGIEVNLDDDTFTIFISGTEYTYNIEEHIDLLTGGKDNGVDVEYIGLNYDVGDASEEDIKEYYEDLDYDDGYDNW